MIINAILINENIVLIILLCFFNRPNFGLRKKNSICLEMPICTNHLLNALKICCYWLIFGAGNVLVLNVHIFAQADLFNNKNSVVSNNSHASLLWEINGNNLPQPAYLYGTMHSKDRRVHQLNDSVYAALNRSKVLALEVVVKPEDQLLLMKQMFMKDTTLLMLYGEKDYGRVKEYVQAQMGNLAAIFKVDEIKPIFLATLLSEIDKDTITHPQTADPLDVYLQKWAESHKKQLIGLETIDEQIIAIDKIPLKTQAKMLLDIADQEARNDSLEQQLMYFYLKQDLDSLLIFYENEKDDVFDKALILTRNKNMADRLSALLQKKQAVFTAVGALHLPGENGLIELLRAKGYRLSPVIDQKKYWKLFQSPAQRFEILFPDKPELMWLKSDNQTLTNPIDTVSISTMYSFADTIEQIYYSLVYIPLDSNSIQQSDSAFYIGISERLLLKDNAYMVSEDTTSYNNHTVYEGEIAFDELDGLSLRFWLFRNQKYAYLLSVTGLLENIYSKKSDIFFNSFKIKK